MLYPRRRPKDLQDIRLEARSLDDIGASYHAIGKPVDAIDAYETCFDITEKILASHHKLTTKIEIN